MTWTVSAAPPLGPSARALLLKADAQTLAAIRVGIVRSGLAAKLWTREVVRANLSAQRWSIHTHDVLVLHNGPLDDEQQLWVALLAGPPGAAIGGLTALELAGFVSTQTSRPTVISRHKSRRPTWPHADYWVSRQLTDGDVVRVVGALPRTSAARSCVDVVSRLRQDRLIRGTVLAVAQQRIAAPADMMAVVRRFPTLPNRALIRESILDAIGGIESIPEREFDVVRRVWRLPEPSRQIVVERPDGRRYLDAEWRRYRCSCEIHGAPHFSVQRWSDDIERQNDLVLARGSMLTFTSYTIRHRPEVVGRQLTTMLRQGGWRG